MMMSSCHSGGEQRCVSFAVALLQEPPLLIMDEPTVGMDSLLRQKLVVTLIVILIFHWVAVGPLLELVILRCCIIKISQ